MKKPKSPAEKYDEDELDKAKRSFKKAKRISALSLDAQAEIVTMLANFNSTRAISDLYRKKYGVVLGTNDVKQFGKIHRDDVLAERAKIMADLDDIPLRYKKVRVVKLSTYAQKFENLEQFANAAALIKQIRDEVGDASEDLGNALKNLPFGGTSVNVGVQVGKMSEDAIVRLVQGMPEGEQKRAIIQGMDALIEALSIQQVEEKEVGDGT